jgi:hypothetical protein
MIPEAGLSFPNDLGAPSLDKSPLLPYNVKALAQKRFLGMTET